MNKTLLLMAALPFALAGAAAAQTISINFDDQYAGSDISTAYNAQGVTFSSTNDTGAVYTDYLPGTDPSDPHANRGIDAASDFAAGYVTVALNEGTFGTRFDVDLIAGPNGSTTQNIFFYDASGTQVGSLAVDETANTHISYAPTAAGFFNSAVLPADAYYDNLSIAAAPEPAAWVALLLGITGLGGLSVRRRTRA